MSYINFENKMRIMHEYDKELFQKEAGIRYLIFIY